MRKRIVIVTILVMTFAVVASGCGKSKDEDKNKNSQQMMEEIVDETEDDFVQEIGKNEVTQETENREDNAVSSEESNQQNNQIANNATQEEQTQQKPTVTPTPEPEVQTPVQSTPEPEIQAPVQPAPEPEVQQPTVSNVFFNDTNYAYDLNVLSIKPRHVYWEDGKLYAECFVINGFNHTVYNINVKSLKFSNNSVDIATAGFGGLGNVTIAPYSYIVWTFVFGEDCIITPNADLSVLRCVAQTSNSY